jgi:FkbH-like protein
VTVADPPPAVLLTAAQYHERARSLEREPAPGLRRVRLALLGSCTLEFARPYLVVEGARLGLLLEPRFAPFGQVEQQTADPGSALYAGAPDALILMVRPEDSVPDAVARPFARGARPLQAVLAELVEGIGRAVETFRSRSNAPVLVANFSTPVLTPLGIFDANVAGSLTTGLAEANAALRERVTAIPNAAVWDYAGLVASRGAADWTDDRLLALARVAVAQKHQAAFAGHLSRALAAMLRPPAKCLVLDLDNTLWGGVIGDDGLAGIQLGDDYPGKVYKDFQRRVLGLMDRGVLLAVVSKNDESVAKEVFDTHPEMLIRWGDIASARINWQPKSGNLREIAADLNIGSDQLVLFDDNPVEQAEVRLNAPEVLVADVPADPLRFSAVLASLAWFDQVALSQEDQRRTDLYRERRQRDGSQGRFGSLDEFLASLEMTAEVGVVGDATMARIAQLIGKTNQFNLTTRRHTASDLAAMAGDPSCAVLWLRVADKFGDQGLVSVAILRREGTRGLIDTFLMSCRVMNRRVEQAMAAYIEEHARRLGCGELVGEFLPTAKNGVVSNLYRGLGFRPMDDEGRFFVLDLRAGTVGWPSMIARKGAAEGAATE